MCFCASVHFAHAWTTASAMSSAKRKACKTLLIIIIANRCFNIGFARDVIEKCCFQILKIMDKIKKKMVSISHMLQKQNYDFLYIFDSLVNYLLKQSFT